MARYKLCIIIIIIIINVKTNGEQKYSAGLIRNK